MNAAATGQASAFKDACQEASNALIDRFNQALRYNPKTGNYDIITILTSPNP
jgi:hypothetical protein